MDWAIAGSPDETARHGETRDTDLAPVGTAQVEASGLPAGRNITGLLLIFLTIL